MYLGTKNDPSSHRFVLFQPNLDNGNFRIALRYLWDTGKRCTKLIKTILVITYTPTLIQLLLYEISSTSTEQYALLIGDVRRFTEGCHVTDILIRGK